MDEITTKQQPKGSELFSKLCVVFLGILVGLIVSYIIGIMTGWIPFEC